MANQKAVTMDVEVSWIEGYSVGQSDEDRLVALLISTLSGEALSVAMAGDVAVQLGEELAQAGRRMQALARRAN